MKIIIDIPDHLYNVIKNKECTNQNVLTQSVENGIPLDDVKAEIAKEENIWYHDRDPENGWKKFDVIRVDTVLEILDNIDKAESEE